METAATDQSRVVDHDAEEPAPVVVVRQPPAVPVRQDMAQVFDALEAVGRVAAHGRQCKPPADLGNAAMRQRAFKSVRRPRKRLLVFTDQLACRWMTAGLQSKDQSVAFPQLERLMTN